MSAKKNKSKIRTTFADVFNVAVANAGFSMLELAEISGVSRSQLYDFKKAKKSPTTDALDALGDALKVDPSDFLRAGSLKLKARPQKVKAAAPKKSAKAKPKKTAKKTAKKAAPKKRAKRGRASVEASSSSVDATHAPNGEALINDLDTPAGMSANESNDAMALGHE